MPKSNLDWLGVVSLWIGAVIMAFKAANAPLMRGAPDWLAANVWTYVPLVLVTFYLLIAIYRQLVPLIEPKTMVPREAIKRSTDESRIDVPFEASSVLPKRVSEEYIELLAQGCTNMQETRFLRLYVGKYIELDVKLISLDDQAEWIRAICRPETDNPAYKSVVIYFRQKWEDHLQHIGRGDSLHFRAKISKYKDGQIILDYAEPV